MHGPQNVKFKDNNHRKHRSPGNAGMHSDSCNSGDGTYHSHRNEMNQFVLRIIKEFTRNFRKNQKRLECERKLQGRSRGREGEGEWCGNPERQSPRGCKMYILILKIWFSALKKF